MDELEEIVAQLQSDNKRLAQENTALRQQQQCPNCHNNNKNIPDSTAVKVEPMSSLISTLTEPEATSKSAVLSPQQKERLQALLVLMMTSCSLIFPKNSRLVIWESLYLSSCNHFQKKLFYFLFNSENIFPQLNKQPFFHCDMHCVHSAVSHYHVFRGIRKLTIIDQFAS